MFALLQVLSHLRTATYRTERAVEQWHKTRQGDWQGVETLADLEAVVAEAADILRIAEDVKELHGTLRVSRCGECGCPLDEPEPAEGSAYCSGCVEKALTPTF